MYKYNRILIVMLIITVIASIFSISASAETVNNNFGEVVVSDEEASIIDTELETEETSVSDLTLTNEYLKYIVGILFVFLIGFLFKIVWKFLCWFF